MRFGKRTLGMFLGLVFGAAMVLPAALNLHMRTVEAGGQQDVSRSDVRPTEKKSTSRAPNSITAAPANDNCANAIAVSPANCPFTDTKDTTMATDEAGEPASTCTAQSKSIWYTFSNPTANIATVSVNTCTSAGVDTAVQVYRVTGGACAFAGFVVVACNDDACGDGLQSSLSFTAQAGEIFKIQVGGFAGDTGSITTNINCEVFECPPVVINGTLGSNDPNFDGVHFSTTQTGRLNRNGISSTCAAPKTCLIFDPAGGRAADVYQIPNESGEDVCVSVNLTEAAGGTCNLQSNAYLNSYNPASICTNYLADPGLSTGVPPTPTNFSFVVPAGQTLVLVVHTTNPGEIGCAYTLTVLGDLCEQFDFCVQDNNNPGRFIKINSTTGAYEYHECGKGITVTGTGVVSTFFCKITLTDSGPDPKRPDRSISVLVNPCTNTGTASVRPPGSTTTSNLTDSNLSNNTCECQ